MPWENNENYENHIIPNGNYGNHKNLRIQYENNEIYENHIIPIEN